MPRRGFVLHYCLRIALAVGMTALARPAHAANQAGGQAALAALSLSRGSEQFPQKVATGSGTFAVSVTLDGTPVELRLTPYSMRRPNCEAVGEGPGGVHTKLELPAPTTYRGTVRGEVTGVVAASLEGDAVRARILLDDGTEWYVQPAPGAPAGTHMVYRSTDVSGTPGACGAEPTADGAREPLSAPQAQSSGCVEADIAIEADYSYYQYNGSSSTQTINDIDAVMNAVELIYSRDAKISYRITNYLVQTTNTGRYPSNDGGTKLTQFRDWWNANQGSVTRDVAHLMTGTPLNGLIGTSFFSVICTVNSAYGLSYTTWTTNMAWRVGLTAHELGHNWGAMHCDGQSDCKIMCPNIGGCTGDMTGFSASSIREIETYRSLSSCLAAGSGTPTALNPTARDDRSVTVPGSAVTINVLANDFDPNCSTISVGSYSSSTTYGGNVTTLGDNLVYTPPAGFLGDDTFQYTARDASGAESPAIVTVSVQDYRPADTVTGAVAGIQVRYYYVPPLDANLTAIPSLSNPFQVDTEQALSIPTTSGAIGACGLTDKVALRATGKIDLPAPSTYTFYLTADDGAKLYIDGTLRVDNDGSHSMQERSASVTLAAGAHDVRVDYYDGTGSAGLKLEISGSLMPRAEIPASMWSSPGVQVSYYQLDSKKLPPFAALAPEKTQLVTSINYPFSWGAFAGSGRNIDVGAVYEGYMTVPSDGVYYFDLTSEDGSRLFIGDQLVVGNDGYHNRVSMTGGIALRAGAHKTRVEYFCREGGNALSIQVWSASLSKQVIPASWWSHLNTVHVPTDYATISSAIAAAPANGMVWVAAGTYVGATNKNLDLGNKNITLHGGGGPELTILDAENSGRAFRFVGHSQANAVVEGFKIIRSSNTAGGIGGAMSFENSTLKVRDCVIAGNSNPGSGGAIGILGASNPTFEDCVISGNRAGGTGGGIQAEAGARPTLTGCTIAGNYAVTSGGGVYSTGGSSVALNRTILWGNGAVVGTDGWTGDASSDLTFQCSDVRVLGVGGIGSETYGSGMIFSDPKFCTPASPSLAPTSGGGYGVAFWSQVLALGGPCGPIIGARTSACSNMSMVTAVPSDAPGAPATALEQNVPNPFNPSTRISFTLLRDGRTTLRIFDPAGRLVATVVNKDLPSGRHTYAWDGLDTRHRPVAAGVYFYQLRSGGIVRTRSMVLLK